MYALNTEGGSLLYPMDVCQTPTPAGEVLVPCPNDGAPPMAEPGCEKVLICGAPALNKASTIPETNGDQAGVGGGVVSGEFMGGPFSGAAPIGFTHGLNRNCGT